MKADKRRARFGAAYSRTVTLTIDFTPMIRALERMIDAIFPQPLAARTGYQRQQLPPSPTRGTAYIVPLDALANPESPTLAELEAAAIIQGGFAVESFSVLAADRAPESYYEQPDLGVPHGWTDAQRVRPDDYDDPDWIVDHIDQVLAETGDQR